MRVLTIANNFPWPECPYDGMFNLSQIRAMRELGHETRVLRCIPWIPPLQKTWLRYKTVPARYSIDGVPVRTLTGFQGPKSFGIGTLRHQLGHEVRAEIEAFRPDVVHVQGLMHSGVLALDSPVPYVVTAHGIEAHTMPWSRPGLERLARSIAGRAAAVVGVSEFIARFLRDLGRPDAEVIFNGADDRLFAPRDRRSARARLGLPQDRNTIVFVGYIEKHKGILDLIQAVIPLKDLRPHLVFAGNGSLRDYAEATLNAAGIETTFLGNVDHAQLGDVFGAADVHTLPSYAEGLPTVICEAMNVGRAVVATRLAGIPEIVKDGESGFIVECGDVRALSGRMRTILTTPELKARMETTGREFAAKHLTWRTNAKAYDAIYQRIVGGRAHGATA